MSPRPTTKLRVCEEISILSWFVTLAIRSLLLMSPICPVILASPSKSPDELTNLFINQNLEVRQQQSEDTTQFLENQLEAASKDLADQEDRIRQFKGQHVGEMPGQLTSNLAILQGLQSQLQTAEDSLNSARQQRVYLQSLADQYQVAARPGQKFRWNAGGFARDRSTAAEAQVTTCRPQFALYRSTIRMCAS